MALRLGVRRDRVAQLVDNGAIARDADGSFDLGDVHRVRLLLAFEDAGVPFGPLLEASRAGTISLDYYDQLHPPPGPLSGRSYAEFRASMGREGANLASLFAAFGLAEPEADSRLTVDDEALIAEMLDTIVATGQPDLALRAIRLFGEGARRPDALGTTSRACPPSRSSNASCGPGLGSRADPPHSGHGWRAVISVARSTSTA